MNTFRKIFHDLFYFDGDIDGSTLVFVTAAAVLMISNLRNFSAGQPFDYVAYALAYSVVVIGGGNAIGDSRRTKRALKDIQARLEALESTNKS